MINPFPDFPRISKDWVVVHPPKISTSTGNLTPPFDMLRPPTFAVDDLSVDVLKSGELYVCVVYFN